jgi:hypothetical protein
VTTVIEPPVITVDGPPLEMSDPSVQAAFAEMTRIQAEFDATRPPCPKAWCDAGCETDGHFGDAVMHASDFVTVSAEADHIGETGEVWIRAQRHDSLTAPSDNLVEIDFQNAGSMIDEIVCFTPAQSRRFAAELLRHADLLEPEYEVPAEQVRVGDSLPVGEEWLYVYSVVVDEPSNNVQIFTTVKPGAWPELDGDEAPHMFKPGDLVRVRRGGAR